MAVLRYRSCDRASLPADVAEAQVIGAIRELRVLTSATIGS